MADEVHQFLCTIPAGTPKSSLYVTKMPLNLYSVDQIDVEVPPGPSGQMGFYLALSGQQWIPWEAGTFIVWNGQSDSWPLTNQPTSAGWELHGYNLGAYPHSVTVRFHLSAIVNPTPPVVPTLAIVTTPLATGTTIL
jgi:hypothetical protein